MTGTTEYVGMFHFNWWSLTHGPIVPIPSFRHGWSDDMVLKAQEIVKAPQSNETAEQWAEQMSNADDIPEPDVIVR